MRDAAQRRPSRSQLAWRPAKAKSPRSGSATWWGSAPPARPAPLVESVGGHEATTAFGRHRGTRGRSAALSTRALMVRAPKPVALGPLRHEAPVQQRRARGRPPRRRSDRGDRLAGRDVEARRAAPRCAASAKCSATRAGARRERVARRTRVRAYRPPASPGSAPGLGNPLPLPPAGRLRREPATPAPQAGARAAGAGSGGARPGGCTLLASLSPTHLCAGGTHGTATPPAARSPSPWPAGLADGCAYSNVNRDTDRHADRPHRASARPS